MANNLFISYRPGAPEQGITRLMRALESLGVCVQVQELFWYVNSDKTVAEAHEVIRDNIEYGDTLIVIDASNNEFEMNRSLREQVESRIRYVWD